MEYGGGEGIGKEGERKKMKRAGRKERNRLTCSVFSIWLCCSIWHMWFDMMLLLVSKVSCMYVDRGFHFNPSLHVVCLFGVEWSKQTELFSLVVKFLCSSIANLNL